MERSASAPTPVSVSLPFSASSAGIARRELRAWLASLDAPEELVDDSQLVISELVGNAIRHARPLSDGTMIVTWDRADDSITLAVTDGGSSAVPQRVDASLSDLAGRGLAIVETVAARWWTETTRSRSTVHASLRLG